METKNDTLERSIAALKAGRPQDALDIVTAAVANAVNAHGKDSPEEARALFDQANLFVILGNLPEALKIVSRAAEIAPKDDPSKALQLDYLKAKGELLQKMGKMDEAKAAYEKSIEGRRALFGEESAGLCRGQLPLADLLLQTGDLEKAEDLIESVAGCFWHSQDEMLPAALALRGFILAARYGDEKSMFEHFDMLPAPKQHQLIGATIQIAQAVPPEPAFVGLQEMRERLEDFESPDLRQDATPYAQELGAIVELQHAIARRLKNVERLNETLDWLEKHYEALHAVPQHLSVLMRRGHLLAAQGKQDESTAAFKALAARLDGMDENPSEIAMPMRCELAAIFATRKDMAMAEDLFKKACAQAEKGKDARHVGSTCAAYGYFLQHSDRPAEAFDWLEKALEAMKGEGFPALELRIHMNAIINGTKCGCTDNVDALTLEMDRRIRAQLPDGLLDGVRISAAKGIELSLKHAPSAEDQEKLKAAIPAAIEQIKALNISRPKA